MNKIILLGAILLIGCEGSDISDIGLHYCDMNSVFENVQEFGDYKKETDRKTEKVDLAYLNVLSKKRFAFTYQLEGLWHTDADMRYEVIGDNLVGNSLIEEKDPNDMALTIEKSIALSVNTSTGKTTRTYTKKHLDKDKSTISTEIRTINGVCSFDSQSI
jgi:hypothetical protein